MISIIMIIMIIRRRLDALEVPLKLGTREAGAEKTSAASPSSWEKSYIYIYIYIYIILIMIMIMILIIMIMIMIILIIIHTCIYIYRERERV